MKSRDMGLRWEPRVCPEKIRRLYHTDARGILDEELLDDVAYALYARCCSIVTVTEAICHGRLPCPSCSHPIAVEDRQAEFIRCIECRWEIKQTVFRASYRNKRLGGFGAIDAFRAYAKRFPAARTPQEKMLLIDRLIHAMHNELADRLQRPAAVNLIEGNTKAVIDLIEGLAYGESTTPGVGAGRTTWHQTRAAQSAREGERQDRARR